LQIIVVLGGTQISRMLHLSPLWFQQIAFDSAQAIAPGSLLAMLSLVRTYRMRLARDVLEAHRRARALRLALQCLVLGPLLGFCVMTWEFSGYAHHGELREYLLVGVMLSTWAFGLFEVVRVYRSGSSARLGD
jgi:hypothetical protein